MTLLITLKNDDVTLMLLQWSYNGVTMMLQWSFNDVCSSEEVPRAGRCVKGRGGDGGRGTAAEEGTCLVPPPVAAHSQSPPPASARLFCCHRPAALWHQRGG